jgi:hypothetical protein
MKEGPMLKECKGKFELNEIFANPDIAKDMYDFNNITIKMYLDSYTKENLKFLNNSKDAKKFMEEFRNIAAELSYDACEVYILIENATLEISENLTFTITKNNKTIYIDIWKDSGIDDIKFTFPVTDFGKEYLEKTIQNRVNTFDDIEK